MRYARNLLKLDEELDLLARKHDGDTTPMFSVQFDMPDQYRAKMVITRNGTGVLTVKCFSWKETEPLRKAVKYGSNHQSKPISVGKLEKVIKHLIQTKQERLFASKNFDPRIVVRE